MRGGSALGPAQVPGATLTTAGTLVTLVRAVQEAIAALGEHDAGLTILALELQGRAGQGAVRGCNK